VIVLVTGGSGFIGRNLVEQLGGKYELLAPTHGELDLLDADAVRSYFRSHQIDVVVNSATHPGHRNAKDPTNLIYRNTRMFFNIVRNRGRFRKMIHLGTGAVYDMRHYRPKMKEEYFDSHLPADETGYSKYVCAKYIEQADGIWELRPFGVFGPHEDWEIRFLSNAICKTLCDLPITIRQNRKFDYVYINDLIRVIDLFIGAEPQHKFYNVTPNASIELETLAQMVLEISGKRLDIKVATPGMGTEYSGDNSRLRSEFPQIEFTPIRAAIEKLYAWYSQNRHHIRAEALLFDK